MLPGTHSSSHVRMAAKLSVFLHRLRIFPAVPSPRTIR